MKHKEKILSLEKDDPKKELEFDVAFQLSLTEKQRYKRMMKLFKLAKGRIKQYEYPETPTIISRS